MKLAFTKMQSLGNDFVMLNAMVQKIKMSEDLAQYLADRHFGVGCDQILVAEKPITPGVDFRLRIFNQDGSEVGQCGNGARCFSRYLYDQKLTDKNPITLETATTTVSVLTHPDETVTVDMAIPVLNPKAIPVMAEKQQRHYCIDLDGQTISLAAVSMGNPHAVIQVSNIAEAEVDRIGTALQTHSFFPERVNVGFMQILNPQEINLRVRERGVGETLGCGSGACAAVVAGILNNQLNKTKTVRVNLPGGSVKVDWRSLDEPVFLTGPVTRVFEGMI